MDMQSQTRLNILSKYIYQWLGSGAQQKHIGYEVGQKFQELGFDKKLRCLDIAFDTHSDASEQGRKNGKKLFRWLGMDSDNPENRERLFEVEPVIVAAMPEDLRKAYLNDIYSSAGVSVVCAKQTSEGIDANSLAAAATKEGAESVIAMLTPLPEKPTPQDIQSRIREHKEAADVHFAAADKLEKEFPNHIHH